MTVDSNDCTPNIAAAGIRRRRRFGFQWVGVSVAAVGAGMIFRVPWIARTAVFLPAAVAAIGLLQASRNTCILRAREGTLEHDDFSTTPAPSSEVAVSRKVATGITRDAILIGVGAGAVAAATALLR